MGTIRKRWKLLALINQGNDYAYACSSVLLYSNVRKL